MTKYIVLEGVEGVGKTTQVQKIVDYLKSKGFKVFTYKRTRNSTFTFNYEIERNYAKFRI